MMNRHWISLGLALGALPLFVSADGSYQQEVDFTYSSTVPSPSDGIYLPDTFFTGSFNPFNSSLGTLVSYTVDWTASVSASVTAGPSGGGMNMGIGGSYYFGSTAYFGNGNGNGTGGGPGATVTLIIPTVAASTTFLPANAGHTYDPAILGLATGNTPFDLKWVSPVTFSGISGVASVTPSVTGNVKLTYNYVPEPGEWAGAAGMAAIGFTACRRWAKRR